MLLDDLRSAARSLARAKVLTTVLLASLGLGTGANAAVYSVIDALLFRPAAGIADADRLASLYTSQYDGASFGLSSLPDARSVAALPAVAGIAAVDDRLVTNVHLPSSTRSTRVSLVAGDFFSVLGMRAARGRLLTAQDEADDTPVAVISESLWEEAGRPDSIQDLAVSIGPTTYRVVGVAPRKFRGLQAGRPSDVWLPLRNTTALSRGDRRFSLVGRLAAGRTAADLQVELDRLASHLATAFPSTNRGTPADPEAPRRLRAIAYTPTHPSARAQTTTLAILVMTAVGLLLLGACVNAGALLLSRGFARTRELAVKMALGAGRRRLVRQLMLESVVASFAGALAGLLFAFWTLQALPAFFAPDHLELLDLTLQPGAIFTTLGGALAAGIVFGVAPAFYATAAPAATALRADTGGIAGAGSGSRLRTTLVGVQVALSTALLLCAGMLIAAFSTSMNADPTFPTSHVIVARVENTGGLGDALRGIAYQRRLAQELAGDGVEALGWSSAMAVADSGVPSRDYRIAAGAAGLTETAPLDVHVVSPGYFDALGLALVEGRLFDANDRPLTAPVVIVDEHFARKYYGAVAAGQYLVDPEGERLRIVGVVRPRRFRALQDVPRGNIYYPFTQNYPTRGFLFLRTSGPPEALMRTLKDRVAAVDPDALLARVATLEDRLAESQALERMTTTLVGACGLLALVMAMMGAYGVMNDAVQRRTREIGLRVALGAARRQVVRLVLAEVSTLALAGCAAGVGIALLAERLLQRLAGLPAALDPAGLLGAPALLGVIIALASLVPLRRALRVSAAIALRAE